MKKVTLLVLTIALGALLLIGCSDNGDKGDEHVDPPKNVYKVDKLVWSLEKGPTARMEMRKSLPLINLNSPVDMLNGAKAQTSRAEADAVPAQPKITDEILTSNPITSSTFYTRLDKKGVSQLFPKESLKPIAVAPNGDLFLFDKRFGIFMTNLNEKNPLPRKLIATDEIAKNFMKEDYDKMQFKTLENFDATIIKNPDGNDYVVLFDLYLNQTSKQLLYRSSDGTITSTDSQLIPEIYDFITNQIFFSKPITIIHNNDRTYVLQYDPFKDEYRANFVIKTDDLRLYPPVINLLSKEFSFLLFNKEKCAVELFKMEALDKQVTVSLDAAGKSLVTPAIEPNKLEKTNSYNLAGNLDCSKPVSFHISYITPSALWIFNSDLNNLNDLNCLRIDMKDGAVKAFNLNDSYPKIYYTETFGDLFLFQNEDSKNYLLYSSAKDKTVSLGKLYRDYESTINEVVGDRTLDTYHVTNDGKFAFLGDTDGRLHRIDVEKTFESGTVVAEPVVDTSERIVSGLLWKGSEYWLGNKGGLYSVSNGKTTQIQKTDTSGADINGASLMAVTVDDVEVKGTGLAISVPLTEEFACERGGFYCSEEGAICKDKKCDFETVTFKDANLEKLVIEAIKKQVYADSPAAPTDKVLLKDCESSNFTEVETTSNYGYYDCNGIEISDLTGI